MISHEIIRELDQEHEYQQRKWGTTVDDTKNTPHMWASYICSYATKALTAQFPPFNRSTTDMFRSCMVKVATLAISAIESIDRQRKSDGLAFFEEKPDD